MISAVLFNYFHLSHPISFFFVFSHKVFLQNSPNLKSAHDSKNISLSMEHKVSVDGVDDDCGAGKLCKYLNI